jgi:predicted permease
MVTSRLVAATACYLVWACGAALLAVRRDLPAEFSGFSTGLSATNDFLIGMGTALSPPLWWMLAQAFFALRAWRSEPPSRAVIGALTGFGAVEFIGALGEPVTLQAFSPSTFDPLLAVTQLGMILLPLAAAFFGVRALRERSQG